MRSYYNTILLAIAFSLGTVPASAAQVDFPPDIEVSGVPMRLQGTGVKSVAFIKAFEAALYKEEGAELMSGGKKLIVEYFVRIPAKKLTKFTVDSMRDNVSEQTMTALGAQLDRMGELFVDLEPGDRFALAYIPGEGTHFLHNGRLTGTIQGEDFAQALYSVWIGERPFDEKLKRAILGLQEEKRSFPFFAQSH